MTDTWQFEKMVDVAQELSVAPVETTERCLKPVGQAKTSACGLYQLPHTHMLWTAELSSGAVVLRHLFGPEVIERPLRAWSDDLAFGRVRQVG